MRWGPTFVADAARHVRGVGAVLEVVPARCRQGGLKLLGPFLVGLGKPPDQDSNHWLVVVAPQKPWATVQTRIW